MDALNYMHDLKTGQDVYKNLMSVNSSNYTNTSLTDNFGKVLG